MESKRCSRPPLVAGICRSVHMSESPPISNSSRDVATPSFNIFHRQCCTTVFEIQMALAQLEQGDRSIREYYNAARELWTEQDILTTALHPQPISADAVKERQQTRLLNFLMRLRPEFEAARSTLLNKDDLRFEGLLSHLVREEIRIRTQANIDGRPGDGETALALASQELAYSVNRPSFHNKPISNEYECHFCHERGHPKKHCRQWNVCVYCKRAGHIILECRTRQRNEARDAGGSFDSVSRSERATGGPFGRPYNHRSACPPPGDRTAYVTALAPGNQ
ncbi:unnamed protein product [Linum trigynum]|uniref:Retrotransposon gag domain-containing protein n=1 Tax=Linum trigynum TaxID=586398 RepID=A0AAV2D7J7_9ROSI